MTTGTRLREAREAAGLDLEDVPFLLKQTIGRREAKSRETIRQYELGDIPEANISPVVLLGLAEVYNKKVSEIVSAEKLAEIERLRELAERRSGCMAA